MPRHLPGTAFYNRHQKNTFTAMKIHAGLLPSMVMPRNQKNVSQQLVTGTCRTAGNVSAAVYAEGNGSLIKNLPNCGKAAKGRFSAHLNGIPCGGPYRIELSLQDEKLLVSDVLVGDLWILGGQSNMQGAGYITGKRLNTENRLRAYYMDDKWGMAQEPIGRVEISRIQAHLKLLNPHTPQKSRKNPFNRGASPALPFAMERYKQTGIPQGLIACAHGGVTIGMWDPATKKQGTDSLYGAMLERVHRNGGRITGMLWYQGCSDTTDALYPHFEQATLHFFRTLRKDLKAPNLPIVQAQIARQLYNTQAEEKGWSVIREAQRNMPRRIRNLLTVPTIDLATDDSVHLNEEAYFILGRRMAEAMQTILREPGALPPPIVLDRAALHYNRKRGLNDVYVYYKNVVGALQSSGRASGFSFGPNNENLAFSTQLKGNCVILKCVRVTNSFAYGWGQNPYCNITDAAGRSLPACDFQLLKSPFFRGEYAKAMMVSAPLLIDENMANVTYKMCRNLAYAPAHNAPPFNCFPDRVAQIQNKGIRFFKTSYKADFDLDFNLAFGYDGNIKMFVDGQAVFTDEKARNPIIPASHLLKQHWKKGIHEIVIAQAMNYGCTWGVSLALECAPKLRDKLPQEIVD